MVEKITFVFFQLILKLKPKKKKETIYFIFDKLDKVTISFLYKNKNNVKN